MISTADNWFRKRTLYPVELWGQLKRILFPALKPQFHFFPCFPAISQYLWGKRGGRSFIEICKPLSAHKFIICRLPLALNCFIQNFKSPHGGVPRGFSSWSGGILSSTTGQIKKLKEELQKLRAEYLRQSADPEQERRIATMIKLRKDLLSQLGAGHG